MHKLNTHKTHIITTLIASVLIISCTLFFSLNFSISTAHASSYTANNASDAPTDKSGSNFLFSLSPNNIKSDFSKMGKDYICTGYNVDVEDAQKVECNLIAAARNFNAGSAQLAGDAIVAAETITAEGTYVGNNIFAAGNNVNIDANVTSETSVIARQATLSGTQPWVHVWADTVILSGNFKNVDVYANRVVVQSDAVITGKLNVTSTQEPQIEAGAHVSNVNFEKNNTAITGNTTYGFSIIFSIIFSLLGTFICGLLLLLLFRTRPFNLAAQRFSKSPARVLLTGLLACIVIPLIACILLISCVGIKSMLLLVAFAFCLGLLSLPFTALALARKIFKKLNKWGGSILMLLIVGALACVPYLGILIYVFCTLFTVGSIILCFFDWRKSVKQSETNNPSNPNSSATLNEDTTDQLNIKKPVQIDAKHTKEPAHLRKKNVEPAHLRKKDIEPAHLRKKDTEKSKKETDLTSPAAADFTKKDSLANNLEQLDINNEITNAKNADNIASNNEKASKSKAQVTEEDLSQAEAILAKLAQEAMLAQNKNAQRTQNSVQQKQVSLQSQKQQTDSNNLKQEEKYVPKLDREAQVQAILKRLQEQQNLNDK